jgi:hypothetical protein
LSSKDDGSGCNAVEVVLTEVIAVQYLQYYAGADSQ